jgi:transcription elongation factor Elf1
MFTCQLCRKITVVNAEGAKERGQVSCWNPECQAEYTVSSDSDGSILFHPRRLFPCLRCNHKQFLAAKLLIPGYEFACNACGNRHKLVEQGWHYTDEIEGSAETS